MAGSKQPVSVLVVIHDPGLNILLLERAAHPGYWQSVTGSRDVDESLAETAVREVAEETGIDCSPADLADWHLLNRFEIFGRGNNINQPLVIGHGVPQHQKPPKPLMGLKAIHGMAGILHVIPDRV